MQVLLLERAAQPGFWQSVTGSREPGDADLEATAHRELLEETGLALGTLTDWKLTNRYEIWPQWRARYAPDVTHNTEHVFGFLVPEITVATLDPAEHTRQVWLPWQEAMEKVFHQQTATRYGSCRVGSRAPQGSLEARPVQLGAVRLGQPALLYHRHDVHLRALLRQRHGRRSDQGPG